MTGANRASRLVWVATIVILLFLVLPIFVVIPISFSSNIYLKFPPDGWSLRWYAAYFGDHGWLKATVFSLAVATGVMLAATVLGTMAAFALVRGNPRMAKWMSALVVSPLIVPTIITAIALYFLFARLHIVDTWIGLVIAHTVLAIPFVVVVVSASLSSFDRTLERAAMSLGAPPGTTLRRVTLPIIAPAILTAGLLSFLASFDEVVIAIFIAGTNSQTLPKKMWEGIWLEITPEIAAASTVVIGFTLLLFALIEALGWRSERAARNT